MKIYSNRFSALPLFLEDFKCKDRRSCIAWNLVCDGRSHCRDGSDEVDCPTEAPPAVQANTLKCRKGSKACKDGKVCVLYSHVCDGERDCMDGSDELGCGEFEIKSLWAFSVKVIAMSNKVLI